MVRYEERRTLRQRPTEVQRKFLETLRDLGPRDNALTAATRRATKRACQCGAGSSGDAPMAFPIIKLGT